MSQGNRRIDLSSDAIKRLISCVIAFVGLVGGSSCLAQTQGLSVWDRPDPWNGSPPTFDPFREVAPWEEEPIETFKRGFFQRLDFDGGWTLPFDNDLETQFGQAGVAVAVPLGSLKNILVVNTFFRYEHWDSNLAVDVPDQLFQTGINFLNRAELSERWTSLVLFQPSVRSDFREQEHPIRYFGVALLQYDWIPNRLQVSGGVVHLGREDLPVVLPAVGVVWTPTSYLKFDLSLPRPRIAYRLAREEDRAETWSYIAGTFGGTTWDVLRASGQTDQVTNRDYGIMFGVERVMKGGSGAFLQAGLHLGRKLEYEIGGEQIDLSNGWSIQGGIRF